MDEVNYWEDGVSRVLRLMKDTFGDMFTYYKGEIINIPEMMLPCCMVSVPKTSINTKTSAHDSVQESIIIILVLNKKDDVNGSQDTDLTEYRLQKLVYGQDPSTAQYLPQTVMYAVRKNFTMNNDTIENNVDIDFTPNLRGSTENPIETQEAYITISLERLILVPNRS